VRNAGQKNILKVSENCVESFSGFRSSPGNFDAISPGITCDFTGVCRSILVNSRLSSQQVYASVRNSSLEIMICI
jgi:hypothetical protein